MKILTLPNKKIRTEVIKQYYGVKPRLYCFSDGNATKEAIAAGLNVVTVDYKSPLKANGFVDYKYSDHAFNGINITSGCLPLPVMEKLADAYFSYLQGKVDISTPIYCPVGSGETLLALAYNYKIIGYTGIDECITLTMTPLEQLIKKQFVIVNTKLSYREAVVGLADFNTEGVVLYNPAGTGGEI